MKTKPEGQVWFGLTAVLLVGAALRFIALGRLSLWLDEAYTYYLTLPTWRDIWGVMLLISDTSPLYYLAVRLAAPAIGTSALALRWVAACAGMMALPVVYQIGRAMFNRAVGGGAMALLAVSPFAVWYARDARPYGFYLLFAALALWGFWRWAMQGRAPWLMVSASAALYLTHYASALLAITQAIYLIALLPRHPLLFRRWFGWQALAALPTAAYVLPFLLSQRPLTGNDWIPRPDWAAPLQTLLNFLTLSGEQWASLGALAVAVVACGLLLNGGPPPLLLTLWLVLPMCAVWLLSFRLPAYIDRFFIPEIIALLLLLARGVERLRQRGPRFAVGLALGGALLGFSLAMLQSPAYAKEDWRSAAQFIQTRYPTAPLLAQDGETLLGLLPYRAPNAADQQATPVTLDAAAEATVVVLRSLADANHAVTKSALFNPLTAPTLSDWFAQNPDRIVAVLNLPGVGIVVIR